MGKMGGTSWLTAVKKVFRSPTKQINDKKSGRRTVDHEQEEEEKVFCSIIFFYHSFIYSCYFGRVIIFKLLRLICAEKRKTTMDF